jgi:hemerythrin-like domain-containing protein
MSCIHNVFIRALNSLWVNATLVKPADQLGFAGYASTLCEILHCHHHGEEDIVFPFLEKQVSMQENVAQHAAMLAGLDAFAEYMKNVANGSEEYDGTKAKGLVEVFGDVLTDHLHAEVSRHPRSL